MCLIYKWSLFVFGHMTPLLHFHSKTLYPGNPQSHFSDFSSCCLSHSSKCVQKAALQALLDSCGDWQCVPIHSWVFSGTFLFTGGKMAKRSWQWESVIKCFYEEDSQVKCFYASLCEFLFYLPVCSVSLQLECLFSPTHISLPCLTITCVSASLSLFSAQRDSCGGWTCVFLIGLSDKTGCFLCTVGLSSG